MKKSYVLHPYLGKAAYRDGIHRLGEELRHVYQGVEETVVMIPILSGALRFAADLIAKLDESMPLEIEPVVARFVGGVHRDTLQIDVFPDESRIRGRHTLVVDDLVTSGLTLHTVRQRLREMQPRSLRSVVMLKKRDLQSPDLACPVEHVLDQPPEGLYVGCGIDYEGRFRNLNYIARLDLRSP